MLREFEAKEDAEGGPDVFGQSVPKQVPTGKEEGGGEGASGEGAALEGVEEGEGEGEEDEEDGEDGEEDDEEDDNGGEGNSSGAKAPGLIPFLPAHPRLDLCIIASHMMRCAR